MAAAPAMAARLRGERMLAVPPAPSIVGHQRRSSSPATAVCSVTDAAPKKPRSGDTPVARTTPKWMAISGTSTRRTWRGDSASSQRRATPEPGQMRLTTWPSVAVARPMRVSRAYATAKAAARAGDRALVMRTH